MDIVWSCIKAFVFGGFVCVIAQILIDKTRITPPKILVGCVGLGIVLQAVGLAEPLVKAVGTGVTAPIIGFGITLAKGVEKMIATDGFLGVLGGGLTATAVGIGAVIVLAFAAALISRPKGKG